MIAVIKTGGKQYLVKEGDKIKIEKIDTEEGKNVTFSDVLLVGDDQDIAVGDPLVKGAKVVGKVIEQGKAKKVNVVKFKSKVRYRRNVGHRQPFTKVEITEIKK